MKTPQEMNRKAADLMNEVADLSGTNRCPDCQTVPELVFHENGDIEMSCEKHGYRAQGQTLQMAKAHWNQFIEFVLKRKVA